MAIQENKWHCHMLVKKAQSLWALCAPSSIACGVMMLDRAFGDQREWEKRLSGSWASQLPLELCGQHYNLSPLLFISLPLSWSPSLNSTDSKRFYAQALSAVRRTDKASAVISDAQTKAKISALNVSNAERHWLVYLFRCVKQFEHSQTENLQVKICLLFTLLGFTNMGVETT